MNGRIMIVDDEQAIRSSLQGLFEDEEYLVSTAASGEEAIAKLRNAGVDCVLLDIWMPGIDGLETLARIQQISATMPVIMMSGHATIDTAVRATRLGAFDFLEKPLSSDRLLVQVRNAIEKRRMQQEMHNLKACTPQQEIELVGNTPSVKLLRESVTKASANLVPMLLLGGQGVGKSMIARLIHQQSARAAAPFLEVDIATVSAQEFEVALLGCKQGVRSAVVHDQQGWLETAQGGTLYLNEIVNLTPEAQNLLVEVVKKRAFQPIGGGAVSRLDVRILAGSSAEINGVNSAEITEDMQALFLGNTIAVPSLQDRLDDLPLLLSALCAEVARELGRKVEVIFDDSVLDVLTAYHWPGNLRELKNYIERSYMLCPTTMIDEKSMLPPEVGYGMTDTDHSVCFKVSNFSEAKSSFEQDYLRLHLDQHDWNISHTAEAIGIERSQLHRKIRALGLERNGGES